jgi:glucose/arabinose dehydrogenase
MDLGTELVGLEAKVIRVKLQNGVPTGDYEDFLTGFVIDDGHVWERPVGVAVAHDGTPLVTGDANGTLWRISYKTLRRPEVESN